MKNIYFWMLTLFCSTLMFSGTNNFTFETQTKGWSMFQTRAFGPDTAFKYDGNFNHVFYANNSATLAEPYCTPEGTISGRYINDFTTSSGISNLNSGFSEGGYGEFNSMTVSQGAGGSVNFTANVEGGIAGFRIWVDWNQDGEFDTSTEVAYASNAYLYNHEGSFTVPTSALTGQTTMRIVSNWLSSSGDIDPCETGFTYGEFEDYTFNVTTEIVWDCPALEANFGSPCDDGNPDTLNDAVNENCECEGIIPPAGSLCESAIELLCNAEPSTYSSVGSIATNTTSCYMGNNGLWFSFEGTGGDVTINSSATFDHEMSIQTGSCDNLSSIACIDDSIGAESYTIESTVANQMYYVYVAHFSGSSTTTGDITISIECATPPVCIPPTDVAISDITDSSFSVSWTPGADNTTWSVAYGNEGWDPVNDAPIDYADFISQPEHQFTNLDSNTTYDFYLIPYCGIDEVEGDMMGPFTFTTLAVAPDNDDACGATTLACGNSIEQSLAGATESLEDSCNGSGTSDVWFTFTTDGSQTYTVAETSNFDAVVQLSFCW